MHRWTKPLAIVALGLVAFFGFGRAWRTAPLDPRPVDRDGADPLRGEPGAGSPVPAAPAVEPGGALAERIALAGSGAPLTPIGSEPAAAAVGAGLTRIIARVVDGAGRALPGATLLAVRPDGRPRGSAPSPPADADGVAALELRDHELRASRDEVYAMTFAVRARGCATAFSTVTPRRHGVTELGTVTLAPGGALAGTVVDPSGAPVPGATVLAAAPVATLDVDELRVVGPDLEVPRPRVESDSTGRFLVEGVTLHEAQLWLHAPGRLWTIDRALPVSAGGITDAGAVVLEPAPPERRIAGQVRLPSSAPAPRALVTYQARQDFDDVTLTADEQGRFVIVPRVRGDIELLARDPERIWSPSALITVPVGAPDVTLVLREGRRIAVTVTDGEGRPLAAAALAPLIDLSSQFFVGGGRMPPGEVWTRTDAAGRASLAVPAEEFSITASKAGHVAQRLGPYTPDAAPSELIIALAVEPTVAGRVTCDGAPVAGAAVLIGQRSEGFVPREAGFPLRFFVNQNHGVRSDAQGHFVCPVDAEWQDITLLVIPEAHAIGERELTLEPGRGARDVEVEVTAGGVIEGAVLPPPGRTAADLVIAGSRGDGRPVWTRVGEDGRYRLERLTPGPWRIEGRLEPPTSDVLSIASTPEEQDFGWNTTARAGASVRHDVDLRDLGDVQLLGRLTLDGAPLRDWILTLEPLADLGTRARPPARAVEPDGTFSLTAPAGRYTLTLAGRLPGTLGVKARYELALVAPRLDWTKDLRTGRCLETVPPGTPRVRLVTSEALTLLAPTAAGQLDAQVPAGRTTLELEVPTPYGPRWTPQRSIQIDG